MDDNKVVILVAMLEDMNNRILALQEITEMMTALLTVTSARLSLLEKAGEIPKPTVKENGTIQ